jgi:alkanesulfonate monooxygenase SsuD/methylene tetrahydromethanopterin reductase-like flavin-dependent oxidoreductase (luciferase family)
MERFNAACAAHPQVPRPKIMVLRHAYVADSEADAQQAANEINAFYCYFGAWFKNERPITQGLIQELTPEEIGRASVLFRRRHAQEPDHRPARRGDLAHQGV